MQHHITHSPMSLPSARAAVALLVIACCAAGCSKSTGPDMGDVTGIVTLDSQPLAGAIVTFAPQGEATMTSGGTSIAVTNEEGRYSLEYSATKTGAVVGKHLVKISTQRTAGEDEEGNRIPPVPEKVPAEYNIYASKNPDMLKEVAPGKNEINFDLKGDGKIIQRPKEDTES